MSSPLLAADPLELATEEEEGFPLTCIAGEHFTDDDRVISSLVDLTHAAVHPSQRSREDRAAGRGLLELDTLEAATTLSVREASGQRLVL